MICYVCKMYYACTDKLGVVGCFRHGRPGGEGSGLAAGFVGKVLVWLGGKGYGQGYRVMVMLMVRLGRYGYGLASWVGFSGMVMVRLRG